MGGVAEPSYVNAVAGLVTSLQPLALLAALRAIEAAHGRVRDPDRKWAPRPLDLDLLVFGRHAISVLRPVAGRSENPAKASLPLTVPHVEARRRVFVLAPLADLAPGLVPPGWGESVATAAARQWAIEGDDAARVVAAWDGEGWRPIA